MQSLAPVIPAVELVPAIPGFVYRPAYNTAAMERRLVDAIDDVPWVWDTSGKQRRQYYGAVCWGPFPSGAQIPAWACWLVKRLCADGLSERPFNRLLVYEHHAGRRISLHGEHEPLDRIMVTLSLLAPCLLHFPATAGSLRAPFVVAPRSLLVLSDVVPSRWRSIDAWRKKDHCRGILVPQARRLSMTFLFQQKWGLR